VLEVFEYWKEHHVDPRWHERMVLTKRRETKIRDALRDYDMDFVKAAIRGIKRSPFHMGDNKAGKKYNHIDQILREAATIERHALAELEAESSDFEQRRRQWEQQHVQRDQLSPSEKGSG